METREEPDLTALAGDTYGFSGACAGHSHQTVRVLEVDPNSYSNWDGDTGTSFAAPAVTAMAALAREACAERWGDPLDARFLRSLLRTAAWGGNPGGDWRYSTPLDPNDPTILAEKDRKDGAGMLLADGVMEFCTTGGAQGTEGGSGSLDLSEDEDFPGTNGDYPDAGWTPPGEDPAMHVMDYSVSPEMVVDLNNKLLWHSEDALDAGTRFRATFSWDSCPLDVTGDAPANRAVDIDLFLVNADTGWIAYASQSVDDVNEGFDVTLPEGPERGHYELWIAWPEGSEACGGGSFEPYGWTLRWWAP